MNSSALQSAGPPTALAPGLPAGSGARCPNCGTPVTRTTQTCPGCGVAVQLRSEFLAATDPAAPRRRLLATVLDGLAPLGVIAAQLLLSAPSSAVRWSLWGVLAAWLAVLVVTEGVTGRTPGKALLGLRTVDVRTGRVTGIGPSAIRTPSKLVAAVGTLAFAGFSYRWDPDGQERTWWDHAARSRVIDAAVQIPGGTGRVPGVAAGTVDAVAARWAPAVDRAPLVTAVPGGVGVGAAGAHVSPNASPKAPPTPIAPSSAPGSTPGSAPHTGRSAGPAPRPPAGPAQPPTPHPVEPHPADPHPAEHHAAEPHAAEHHAAEPWSAEPRDAGAPQRPSVSPNRQPSAAAAVSPPQPSLDPGTGSRPRDAAPYGNPHGDRQPGGPVPAQPPGVEYPSRSVGWGHPGVPPGPPGALDDPAAGAATAAGLQDPTRVHRREELASPARVPGRSTTTTLQWDTGVRVVVGGTVLIGRDPVAEDGEKVDRRLAVGRDSVGVSKTHLLLSITTAGVTVTDRHSTNGVRLEHEDGTAEKCRPDLATTVRSGDIIRFGGRSITLPVD